MIGLIQKLLMPPPPKFHGVMGIYYFVDDAASAVTTLREAGHKDLTVFSPVPHHEIEEALEQGPSVVRWVTFVGGVLGATGGTALCWYSIVTWPLIRPHSVPMPTVLARYPLSIDKTGSMSRKCR